jgi:hypothetical protein
MFQLPFSSCFNIRRFAIRFNESFAFCDEFSMKKVWEVVFFSGYARMTARPNQ